MTEQAVIEVCNVSQYAKDHHLMWWAVKVCEGYAWYDGAYANETEAWQRAKEIDGTVVKWNE